MTTTPEAITDIAEATKILEAIGNGTPVAVPPSVVIGHVAITRHEVVAAITALEQALKLLDAYSTSHPKPTQGLQFSSQLHVALTSAKSSLAASTLAYRRLNKTMIRKKCMPALVGHACNVLHSTNGEIEVENPYWLSFARHYDVDTALLDLSRIEPSKVADLLYLVAEPETRVLFNRADVIQRVKDRQAFYKKVWLSSLAVNRPGVAEALKKMHAEVPRD